MASKSDGEGMGEGAKTGLSAVQIKVCGLTRAVDTAACETLGIEWAGFNFWPKSKRYIAPEAAQVLVAGLKNTRPVGVFVNPTRDEVMHAIEVTGIRYVQLHGDEGWPLISSLPVPVIKAIPANRLHDLQGLTKALAAEPERLAYLLIDTPAGAAYGGTGMAFDWAELAQKPPPLPFFLAGGLGPDNVAQAVAKVQPMAVDLNSKVESSPGLKDKDLLIRCLLALGRRLDFLAK
jgi:phosphoribosylanthranilate isomerase